MTKSANIAIEIWMTTDMELSGNELTVFTYIYGMYQSDLVNRKSVSVTDITNFLHIDDRSVTRNIKSLLDKGYIQRRQHGKAYLYYPCNDIITNHAAHDGFDFAKSKGRKKKYDFKDDDYTAVIDDFVSLRGKSDEELRDTILKWLDYKRDKQKSYSPDDLQNQLDRLYDACKTPKDMIEIIKISKSRVYSDITYTNHYTNQSKSENEDVPIDIDSKIDKVHEFIKEVVHAVTTQGNFCTQRHALTYFESCDGFFSFGDDGFLTCNQGHVCYCSFQCFAVCNSFTNAHVDYNFLNFRNFHNVFILEFVHQAFNNFGQIFFL